LLNRPLQSWVLAAALCTPALPAFAAADGKGSAWEYSVDAATARVPGVDLDGGGRTSLSSVHLRAGARRSMGPGSFAGFGIKYDRFDRDFSGSTGFAALTPWDTVHGFAISGALNQRIGRRWSVGVWPFVEWASESGDLDSDALSYGSTLAVVTALDRDKRIGLGASISHDIDNDTSVRPIFILDWKINEQWSVSNPRRASFAAPAGLAVNYHRNKAWQFALAGVYDSSDFRLDDTGFAAGGIGERDGILAYLRVTRVLSPGLSINGYAGAVFNGELEVRDSTGRLIASSDYDSAPLAALSVEGRF